MAKKKFVRGSFTLDKNITDLDAYYAKHKATIDGICEWADKVGMYVAFRGATLHRKTHRAFTVCYPHLHQCGGGSPGQLLWHRIYSDCCQNGRAAVHRYR